MGQLLDENSVFESSQVSQAMIEGFRNEVRKELTKEFMEVAEQHIKGIVDQLILNMDANMMASEDFLQQTRQLRFSYCMGMAAVKNHYQENKK